MSEIIHSYPWYPADWQRSETRFRLSLEGRAVYRELLDYCWQNGSLPADEKHLAKIADCTVMQLRKHWRIFGNMFILNGDRYENERVNEGRPRLSKWRETRKKAGAIGGKKRAENQAYAQAHAIAHAQAGEFQAVLKPSSSSSSSSITTPIVPALDPAEARFEQTPEYWAENLRDAHPKPSAKRLVEQWCVDHWLRIGDANEYAVFMGSVRRALGQWCEAWRADGNRYAPTLQAWLHDESYQKAPPKPKGLFDDADPFAPRRPQ